MYTAIIAAILGVISTIAGVAINASNTRKQIEHDTNMAQMNFDNQKKLMDYQNELSQSTNTIATQTGHAAAAGVNPALMYGNMSPAMYSGSQASNTGAASQLPRLDLFNKLDTPNVVETMLQKRSQDISIERNRAAIDLDRQKALREAAETADKLYSTGLRKQLEKTIVSQQMAQLHLTELQGENLDFITKRGVALLPGELESQGLINQETSAKIEKLSSDTLKNRFEMSQIRADIERLNSVTELNKAEQSSVVESTRRSAIGRVMSEFGLTNRLTPAQLRSSSALHNALNSEQMKGAYITLRNLGFSEHEASNAVIYYSAQDPKDVSPSVVNSASRILSALVLKK